MSIISKGEVWHMTTTPGPWYACSEPERPTDPYVVWHYDDCPACRIKAQVVLNKMQQDMAPSTGTMLGEHLIFRMDNGHWPPRES